MKRQQTLAFSMVLGLMLSGSLSPALAQDEIADMVIVATNSVLLNKDLDITGDVVANTASSVTLANGVELSIEADVTVSGTLTADSIFLDPGVSADAVACNDIGGLGAGSFQCGGLGLPVFPETIGTVLPLFVTGATSGQDLTVPRDGSDTIDEGDFGDIVVERDASLCFSGGIYNVRSINAGNGSTLFFAAGSEVRVEGRLFVGANSTVGPDDGSADCSPDPPLASVSASDIIFYVAGINGLSGGLLETPLAVAFGGGQGPQQSTISANFYAPNGTTKVSSKTRFKGSILGQDVVVDRGLLSGTELEVESFFAEPSPVAELVAVPQDVFTDGEADVVITLTASDPENDDLTFSIVGGLPQTLIETPPGSGIAGTLLADLTEIPLTQGGTCSVSGDPCVDFTFSSDCPGYLTGETCVADPSQVQSATITYDPANADDLPTSFTFKATDGTTIAMANVRINPVLCDDGSTPPCDPPPPVATVVAAAGSAETRRDIAVTITLEADAPCDGDCDGLGLDGDVPLSFAIVGGTPLTTATGGTVDALTQGTEVPQRTATVTYTPADGFVGPPIDSFDFVACGTINAIEVCDVATVTVEVTGPILLAEDVAGEVEASAAVGITLVGNSGGVGDEGKSSPVRVLAALKAVGLAEASAVGAVADTDFDGFGDQVLDGSGGFEEGTDFESPVLGPTEGSRVIDPYVFGDTVMGIDGGGGTFVVGLVKNSETSACVDPPSDDQKLGIGTTAPDSVGFASAAVRATFPEPLPPGAEVAVDFQTALGEPIRIRLFDSQDQPVGSAIGTASPAAGQCGLPGPQRARTTLTAVATGSAAYAVMDLDTSTGGVVFVLDDFSFTAGGTVSAGLDFPDTGERRIQIEWDVSGFPTSGLVSASVTVETVKGEDDTLDTSFFAGDAEQDAVVTPSDFEAAAGAVPGATMPVPADPVGTEGTFTFDVLNALIDAIGGDAPLNVFSISGRVDSQSTGQGLQVRTDPLPTLQFATPPPIPPSALVFTVLSAPTLGTLLDSSGEPVVIGEPLASPELTYVGGAVGGVDSFTYQVEEFGIVGTAVVVVAINDGCAEVGRPPGCSP